MPSMHLLYVDESGDTGRNNPESINDYNRCRVNGSDAVVPLPETHRRFRRRKRPKSID